MTSIRNALALTTLTVLLVAGLVPPAQAASAMSYGPQRITGIPAAGGVKVQLLGTVDVAMQAGQTAYVYSSMKASAAEQVTLVDNEVLCSGAGASNVVMGENIDPAGSANTDRVNITIVTRFLVSATSTGSMVCRVYYRGHSLSELTSAITVEGELRFAASSIGEDVNGLAMQTSLPNGNTPVSSIVRIPVLDRTLTASQTKVDVIADVEFMACYPFDANTCGHSSDRSDAKFTLFVNQMNGDTVCKSATAAQSVVSVLKQTHHKAVPLYTSLDLAPGCRRLYAYVKAEYVSGAVGSIQGETSPLPDADGNGTHTSVMTHMFAVPR